MEKLRLPVDRLRVETFEPAGGAIAAVTANAFEGMRTQNVCNPDRTTVFTLPCCP